MDPLRGDPLPDIRPLIQDPSVIAEAYLRSGLYPISDLVVLRPGLIEQHPDVPTQLVDVFARANAQADRYRDADEQRLADREIELLGEDPHQYVLGPNQRHNVQAYLVFFERMGALERSIPAENLFVASTV